MATFYLRLYIKLFLLRIGPQDVPYSRSLLYLTLVMFFGVSLYEGYFLFPAAKNIAFNSFDLGSFLLFLYIVLQLFNKMSRFTQTLSAACGVGVLFRLLELPIIWFGVTEDLQTGGSLSSNAILYSQLLFLYGVIVMGHILGHALSVKFLNGVLLMLGYAICNLFILSAIF